MIEAIKYFEEDMPLFWSKYFSNPATNEAIEHNKLGNNPA